MFVATKKVGQQIFFTSLCCYFGSGIWDGQKSGSGIRNKHPGSATLLPQFQNQRYINRFYERQAPAYGRLC
jgi:hypothetical protein